MFTAYCRSASIVEVLTGKKMRTNVCGVSGRTMPKISDELYAKLAGVACERGKKDLALKVAARGLKRFPKSPSIWNIVADIHRVFSTGRSDAERSYFAFRRAGLTPEDYYYDVAWASYAWLLEHNGMIQEAERAYETAIEADPTYRWPVARLSRMLRRHTNRYMEAAILARKSVEIDPEHSPSWFNLAYIYDKHLNQKKDAEIAYRKCLELDPDYVAAWQNFAAMLAFDLEEKSQAEEAFARALELEQGNAWTWTKYGHFLRIFTAKFTEAEEAFYKALALDGNEWGAYVGLGRLYNEKLVRLHEARQFFLQAKALGAPSSETDYQIAKLSQTAPTLRLVE
ncbi:tetratricopeptide repeat protein [Rhizobium sp. PP-F2F-G38]|nr:tetratricopeptide repeat protein [Rhizobium sp. PP-WC-1G-195]PYE91928.1 tetratricopeptide repeat protein [Rhizobium sp. PP-F2F-G38]TCP73961.1 tetratricopeptide repeat protein [Rhizobium sp. PP-CC-2G-626]